MKKYRKGSILLEPIAAMAIILIVIMMSYKMCAFIEKKNNLQMQVFNEKEALNAVCNEINYNISFDELDKKLNNSSVSIKYDDRFLDKLSSENLFDMDSAENDENRFVIELINKEESDMQLKVQLINNTGSIEVKIRKGKWMDYV